MTPDDQSPPDLDLEPVAGGGLMHRRAFLVGGALAAGAAGIASARAEGGIASDQPHTMRTSGSPLRPYGQPSKFEEAVVRTVLQPYGELAPGAGVSMTPLQAMHGTITPNGLHFNRSHNGVPDIDPEQHELLIHGLVERPLIFTLDKLMRYPTVTRTLFIECSGNSFFNSNLFPEAMQVPVGMIHGLVSSAEWTGIPLSTLLDEAGIDPSATWVLAEGADAAGMSRSVPLSKCLDDAMVALYQNGERVRPEQGYPMRLLLPGFEGNTSVKWLRRIKLTDGPTHTKDETSKYTETQIDGISRQFTLTMDVKSTITRPALGVAMSGRGLYEVSGLAWSGHGTIEKVEVSADGGVSWAEAAIEGQPQPHALVRFRAPWQWDGGPTVLQSRAFDTEGNVQPNRSDWSRLYAAGQLYHCNAIQAWSIAANGEIKNVFS
jgi:sulfane dehydrogenase subunit SoxC